MSPITDSQDILDTQETNWRSVLLRRLTIIATALVALVAIAVLAGSHSTTMRLFSVSMLFYAAVLGPLLLLSSMHGRTKAIILVASFCLASALAYVGMGFLAGPALTVAFSLVVAGLLLGRTVFISILLGFSAFLVLLTVLVATGIWQGPTPADTNPGDPVNWIRTGVVTIAVWTGLGFSIMYVDRAIEENLSRRRDALEKLQEETAERQAAEKARRDAETVASQAQKMDAVGQLAAGIAHDVNNALLVIRGWNEIRGRDDASDAQKEATEAIERAAEHTAQLSRRLLTFARKDIRSPRHLRLDELVEETATTLRNVVGSAIELRVESQGKHLVHADESQVQQMIFNLVINSRDAIIDKGVVRLSLAKADASDIEAFELAGDDWVVLRVEDDGPGIDEETQQRVFEPFFTTKPHGEGTGLGLSTVLSIVEQSDGHIDLVSRPGKTVFSIFLPAAERDQTDQPTPAAYVPTKATSGPLRILVLEDDPLALQMFVSWLKHDGHTVAECDDGDAALSVLSQESEPFDLLCSDAVFPGASLDAVLDAFESHSPDGKVLICSGYVRDELAIRKLQSGEYAFLAKPFAGEELLASIRAAVDTRATAG